MNNDNPGGNLQPITSMYDPKTGEYRAVYSTQETPSAPPAQSPYASSPYAAQPAPPNEQPKKKSGRGGGVLLVIFCLIVSIIGGYAGARVALQSGSAAAQTRTDVLFQAVERVDDSTSNNPLSTADVVAMVQDSVVEVTTEEMNTSSFFQQYVETGAGSGVILSEDGTIVTCAHVVEGASSIKVVLSNGETVNATLVGLDQRSDLAVLRINKTGLTPAVIGDSSKLAVGEAAIAIGNPLGSLGGTVTSGIISALERDVTIQNQAMVLLQTNAAVNPGNSGGGLFNARGELIGIVNAKSFGTQIEGLGFAIPSNDMSQIVTQIIENGYVTGRPALGVTVIDIQDAEAAQQAGVTRFGVYINSVSPGSGAEKAGLMQYDYILSIDGAVVDSSASILALLSEKSVGDVVELQIIREDKTLLFEVTLGELSA